MDRSQPLLFDELVRCRAWIEAALKHFNGTHNFDDIVKCVMTCEFQFWPLPNAVVLTEIQTYPRKRVLHVMAAGGDIREILSHEAVLEQFALDNKCTSLTCSGRRGWLRVVKKDGLLPASYTTERTLWAVAAAEAKQ